MPPIPRCRTDVPRVGGALRVSLALDGMQRHGAGGAHRRAVSRGRTEWRTFLETRAAAHRELLILACPRHLPRELLGLEVAHDPRRHAQHERPGRHDDARRDYARYANKTLRLPLRVVHDERADADEHAAAYGAAVKDRPVADVRVLLEPRLPAGKGVQHAAVLHVRARAEDDAPEVAPERRAGADIAARSYQAIADEHRLRVHERRRVDDRNEAFQTVRRHRCSSLRRPCLRGRVSPGEEGADGRSKLLRAQLRAEDARLRVDPRPDLIRLAAQQATRLEERNLRLPRQLERELPGLGKE